jgi:small G protein signaling modulator 1
MKRQIISRAFYGWLAYCRHLSTVRTHLSGLVHGRITPDIGAESGLTEERWRELHDEEGIVSQESEVYRLVYYGSMAHEIRKEVWPYLLGHYTFGQSPVERKELDENTKHYYETTMSEWLAVEAIVRQLDKEKTAHAVAKLSSGGGSGSDSKVKNGAVDVDVEMENEVFEENGFSDDGSDPEVEEDETTTKAETENEAMEVDAAKEELPAPIQESDIKSSPSTSSYETVGTDFVDYGDKENFPLSPKLNPTAVIVTDASIDMVNVSLAVNAIDETAEETMNGDATKETLETVNEELSPNSLDALQLQEPKSACVSPASSNGGIYSVICGFSLL